MKNIIFIAPHGTGKGTQCHLITEKFGFKHLSTGDLIRSAIKKQDAFAKELEKTINSGALVSDEIVLEMLKDYLKANEQAKGIIFDGYPRTLNQAFALDELMNELQEKIAKVFYLEITKEEALKRTMGRLICPNCQQSYNKFYENLKPQKAGICDKCGSSLITRDDDTEEAFNNLFEVFMKQTLPILDYYQNKGILKKIDASKTQEEMFKEVEEEINEA